MAGYLFDTLEDTEQAWNYIFIFNVGISMLAGNFFYNNDLDDGLY